MHPSLCFLSHKVRRSSSVILKSPLCLKNPKESVPIPTDNIQSLWSLWTLSPRAVKSLPREK